MPKKLRRKQKKKNGSYLAALIFQGKPLKFSKLELYKKEEKGQRSGIDTIK